MDKTDIHRMRWGIGLRPHHFVDWLSHQDLPVLELMVDNLIDHEGGPALSYTHELASRTTVVAHGVALNLGGFDPLVPEYLERLKRFCQRFEPMVISDHLCFSRAESLAAYELLPLPRNGKSLERIVPRIQRVQDVLQRQFTIENISSYIAYRQDSYSEGEFMSEIVRRSGCGVLLDINNLYVNSVNFGFSAAEELCRYPLSSVRQLHIAGHSKRVDFLFDTHDQPVCDQVVAIGAQFLSHVSGSDSIPVILEWDDTKTPLAEVLVELESFKSRLFQTARRRSEVNDARCIASKESC
jgi:uncharacterized protein (UPF0276 family)